MNFKAKIAHFSIYAPDWYRRPPRQRYYNVLERERYNWSGVNG